jgi:tetratricopeptide (TPR) repeat protein
LKWCGNVKRTLKDYQVTLEDFDKVDILEPNNAFTLQNHGDVKRMLEDYQGALEDFHKANVVEPNNVFALGSHGDVKKCWRTLKEPWRTLTRLMFLNPTMHSLCKVMDMSKGCWTFVKEP